MSKNKAQVSTKVFFRDMEAFLKTGKVGANPGGSTSKPASKTKGEKRQGPVGSLQPLSWAFHTYIFYFTHIFAEVIKILWKGKP